MRLRHLCSLFLLFFASNSYAPFVDSVDKLLNAVGLFHWIPDSAKSAQTLPENLWKPMCELSGVNPTANIPHTNEALFQSATGQTLDSCISTLQGSIARLNALFVPLKETHKSHLASRIKAAFHDVHFLRTKVRSSNACSLSEERCIKEFRPFAEKALRQVPGVSADQFLQEFPEHYSREGKAAYEELAHSLKIYCLHEEGGENIDDEKIQQEFLKHSFRTVSVVESDLAEAIQFIEAHACLENDEAYPVFVQENLAFIKFYSARHSMNLSEFHHYFVRQIPRFEGAFQCSLMGSVTSLREDYLACEIEEPKDFALWEKELSAFYGTGLYLRAVDLRAEIIAKLNRHAKPL